MSEINCLEDLLDEAVNGSDSQDVTLGQLLDAVQTRSFGPLLLLPAFIAFSPIGAIPGMSVLLGTLIILLAGQLLASRDHPWLPSRLQEITIRRERLSRIVDSSRPWVSGLDHALARRLQFLTARPFDSIVAGVCILLAILFYPLALVPGGVAVPSGAMILFSLGLTARDGLLVLVGFLIAGLSFYLSWAFWPF